MVLEKEKGKDDVETASEELQEEIDHLATLKAKIKMKEKDEKTDIFLDTIECLADSIDEMNEMGKQKLAADQALNKSLDASIAKLNDHLLTGKAIETAVEQLAKRDGEDAISVTRLIREINKQTQELTAAVSKVLTHSPSPAITADPQIKEVLALIERSNKSILTSLTTCTVQMDKTIQTLASAITNRPTAWRHEIYYQGNGKLNYVISTIGKEKAFN